MIEINIHKTLGKFHLNMEVKSDSKRIGILGASGCGKSMTLKCIAGIESPDHGKIVLEGNTLYDREHKINVKPQKRRIGYLFQNYALFPTMSVRKNIMTGLKCSKAEREHIADRMIAKFQLDGLGDRLPNELSGGQQQRAALARIMAYEPDVILLDEPFSALDEFLKDRLQQELIQMLEDYQGTVILVSHSRDEIYRFSDELVIMDQGQAVCHGKTKEIFNNPRWKEAARLTGCKNITEVVREDEHHLQVPGWGIRITLEQQIEEDISYVGVRAHDFEPIWLADGEKSEEGWIKARVDSTASLPFEHRYFLKGSDEQEEVCWFVQRNLWDVLEEKGMPGWLKIPEQKLLLLK